MVTYDDPDAVRWDEGERYALNTIERTVGGSEDVRAAVTFEFDPVHPEETPELDKVALNGDSWVSVVADPWEY